MFLILHYLNKISQRNRGATTAEKLRGSKFGSQHGSVCSPRPAKGRAGCWVREGAPPPAVRVRGYHPRKIFEKSDAKSYLLVTTSCEISCFLKTTVPRNLKVGETSLPRPYGCCAYAPHEGRERFKAPQVPAGAEGCGLDRDVPSSMWWSGRNTFLKNTRMAMSADKIASQ